MIGSEDKENAETNKYVNGQKGTKFIEEKFEEMIYGMINNRTNAFRETTKKRY